MYREVLLGPASSAKAWKNMELKQKVRKVEEILANIKLRYLLEAWHIYVPVYWME